MMRPSHIGAHTLTVAGFAGAVWWLGDIRISAASMLLCLLGIAWFVVSLAREEA
jgi:hypothetical protein